MEEKKKNRREWVKTVAIVFLSILLVLTFFSNTIMNYSLPEVAAQYAQSGTITAKIRGGGIVESGDPYEVVIKQTRKISSINVKVGDKVEKGDVLMLLEDEESTELETALKAYQAAMDAYDAALLSADVTANAVNGSHSNTSTGTYRQRIDAAQAAVDAAQKDVDQLQKRYNEISAEMTLTASSIADADDEKKALDKAQTDKENADFALKAAKNNLDSATAQLKHAQSVSSGDAGEIETINALKAQENAASQNYINAQKTANAASLAYDKAKAAYDKKIASEDTEGDVAELQHELDKVKVELDDKNVILTQKNKELTDLTADIGKTLNLEILQRNVADTKEAYDKLLSESVDAVVTADISGTVTSISAVSGKELAANQAAMVLQPEGKGYTMSFSVTNEQAKRVSVGDVAEVVNGWRYDDLNIVLSSIKPDTANPGQNKLLTFDISGDVTPGQNLSVSVGQKSSTYDCIVPNSAVREDNNGKFVLIVESKSSPLGNRYYATRVDVQVIASDDTQSAVTGGLAGWEFVITTSNKPVEAGKLVRLSEN